MAYKLCFYGCCCFCGLGLWPGRDSVFSVLICLCNCRLEKADWQHDAWVGIETEKHTLYVLLTFSTVKACWSRRTCCLMPQWIKKFVSCQADTSVHVIQPVRSSIWSDVNSSEQFCVLDSASHDLCTSDDQLPDCHVFYKPLAVNRCVRRLITNMFLL